MNDIDLFAITSLPLCSGRCEDVLWNAWLLRDEGRLCAALLLPQMCCGYNIVFDIFVHMHFFALRDEYKLPSSVPRVQGCGVKCLHTGILRDEYKLQTSERHEVVDVTCVVA